MRISIIYTAVTVASILSHSGLVFATDLGSEFPKDIAPCSLRLRKVSRNEISHQSLFATGLGQIKAVARRMASMAPIHLFDTTKSDMGCHAKALRGDGTSAPVFLFKSASQTDNHQERQDKENANHKSSDQLWNESQMQQIVEGARVAIYWPKYNKYYEAVVLQVNSGGEFQVEYIEDQYTEWVDAGRDTFRFVRGPGSLSSSQDDGSTWTQVNMQNLLRSAKNVENIQNVGNDDVM